MGKVGRRKKKKRRIMEGPEKGYIKNASVEAGKQQQQQREGVMPKATYIIFFVQILYSSYT